MKKQDLIDRLNALYSQLSVAADEARQLQLMIELSGIDEEPEPQRGRGYGKRTLGARRWSDADTKTLVKLALDTPKGMAEIARELNRTESAVQSQLRKIMDPKVYQAWLTKVAGR